jgi:hypothetical protein
MKLSAYIVAGDSGFSPNPFGGRCTLACCKPRIRRNAEPGDIIVGSGSARSGLRGRLIYAMRVRDVLPFEVYWKRYPSKRPSARTAVSRRGNNIWYYSAGAWRRVPGALHDESQRSHDLSGRHALVATEFYYFGRDAIVVPERFSSMLAIARGHKNTHDAVLITRFWKWLSRVSPRNGRIGRPMDFPDGACHTRRAVKCNEDEGC